MGTHPIFESDFDCLTASENILKNFVMTVGEGNYVELKKSYDYAAKRNRELHDKVSDLEFQNMLLRENFKLRNKKDFDPFQEQEIKMKNLQKKFDDLITEKEIWKNDCARITTEEVEILSFFEKMKKIFPQKVLKMSKNFSRTRT